MKEIWVGDSDRGEISNAAGGEENVRGLPNAAGGEENMGGLPTTLGCRGEDTAAGEEGQGLRDGGKLRFRGGE